MSGAIVAVEMILGAVLALIVTFFFLKDGRRMVDRAVGDAPAARRDMTSRAGDRAWDAAGATCGPC